MDGSLRIERLAPSMNLKRPIVQLYNLVQVRTKERWAYEEELLLEEFSMPGDLLDTLPNTYSWDSTHNGLTLRRQDPINEEDGRMRMRRPPHQRYHTRHGGIGL